ncbi:MAG: serine kinase [Candidatus Sumerlaeia bacterium]|nr:serine kinase [Candidatus Sumerlaeia bacterium]
MNVFFVEHCHELPCGCTDAKMIGIFSSRDRAEAAVQSLKEKPGFRAASGILAPDEVGDRDGFFIGEWEIDVALGWGEGFVTDLHGA